MGIKSDGGPDGPDGLMPFESKSSTQMQIQIDMRLTGAKADLKNIVAKVISCAVKEPKTQRSPDVISLKRCEVLDKVREIEEGITQKNSWMANWEEFISNLENKRLQEKLQFPKYVDLRSTNRHYSEIYNERCPVYIPSILVIQKHSTQQSDTKTQQEWKDCLQALTVPWPKGSHSNFKTKDAEFLMEKAGMLEKETKVIQKRRKRGAISKMKTLDHLQQAEEHIPLYRRNNEQLHTITVKNLVDSNWSFSCQERRYLKTPMNLTLQMRQENGKTVIKKRPDDELKRLIEGGLKDEVSREMAADEVREKRTLTRAFRKNPTRSEVFKNCNLCTTLTGEEKIVYQGQIVKHVNTYHKRSFDIEELKNKIIKHVETMYPNVETMYPQESFNLREPKKIVNHLLFPVVHIVR